MEIIFVTGSEHKLKEFREKLPSVTIDNEKIDLVEVQGTSEEVIIHKAKEAFFRIGKPCIVEDTSMGFKEWNWLPGPYVKDFNKRIGVEKYHTLLKNKTAKVFCYIAYAKNENDITVVVGEVEGKIVPAKGQNGFDFDKVFVPEGHEKTFAEMTTAEKNKISHRGKAIEELKKILQEKL